MKTLRQLLETPFQKLTLEELVYLNKAGYLEDIKSVLNIGGGGTGTPTYSQAFTGVSTLTVTSGTHGKGTAPIAFVYELDGLYYKNIDVDIQITGTGDVTFISNVAITGKIYIA